jgi:hypothetical protein
MNQQDLVASLNDLEQDMFRIVDQIKKIKKDIRKNKYPFLCLDAVVIGRTYKITCWNNLYLVRVTKVDKVEYSKNTSVNGIHGYYNYSSLSLPIDTTPIGCFTFKDISQIEEV